MSTNKLPKDVETHDEIRELSAAEQEAVGGGSHGINPIGPANQ